jgi:hypothetical protein
MCISLFISIEQTLGLLFEQIWFTILRDKYILKLEKILLTTFNCRFKITNRMGFKIIINMPMLN